jgi:ribosomal-protein-alanine N-acetyltransferase
MSEAAFPVLDTPRLQLREIVPADAPALFAVHGDPGSMQWFGTDPLPDLAAAVRLVEVFAGWRTQANPGTRWGLQVRGQSTLIGTCGLFSWNRHWRKCTVGYELLPQARGLGYMEEALRAILGWGFTQMQLNRVEALVHPHNEASWRLLQRLGFQREGLQREVGHWGGQFHDMWGYALLQREWRAAGRLSPG